jgi:DNA-binding response OmpR family regulator
MADTSTAVMPSPSEVSTPRARVLAVDDQKETLGVIKVRIEDAGMECLTCSSGVKAIELLKRETVDLIILDVLMPVMDGFEVCRRLKSDPKLKDVPVLFLTVYNQTEEKMLGFDAGAHDYIAKPVDKAELLARVRAALRVKQLQDQLKEQIQRQQEHFQQQLRVEQKLSQLQQEMLSAHWQKLFSQLAASIAHEINNPLTAATASVELLLCGDSVPDEIRSRLEVTDSCLRRAGERLRQLLFIARPSQHDETVQLHDLINDLAALTNYEQLKHKVTLTLQLESGCEWHGFSGELGRAILYLLNNAIEAAAEQTTPRVGMTLARQGDQYQVRVSDNGNGISAAVRARLFEPLFTTKGPPHTGAGLHLAQLIIKAAGGNITVESPDSVGRTSFNIMLPVKR